MIAEEINQKLVSLPTVKEYTGRLGLKTPQVRKLATQYFAEIKTEKKSKIFSTCQQLIDYGYLEHKIIAFDWIHRIQDQLSEKDLRYFKRWSKNHIVDWVDCDDLCTRALGPFLHKFPQALGEIRALTESKKWQTRRVAAVGLVYPIRKKKYIREVFMTVNALVTDEHELVQKGYAWLLKETGKHYPQSVAKYLKAHEHEIPRPLLKKIETTLKSH